MTMNKIFCALSLFSAFAAATPAFAQGGGMTGSAAAGIGYMIGSIAAGHKPTAAGYIKSALFGEAVGSIVDATSSRNTYDRENTVAGESTRRSSKQQSDPPKVYKEAPVKPSDSAPRIVFIIPKDISEFQQSSLEGIAARFTTGARDYLATVGVIGDTEKVYFEFVRAGSPNNGEQAALAWSDSVPKQAKVLGVVALAFTNEQGNVIYSEKSSATYSLSDMAALAGQTIQKRNSSANDGSPITFSESAFCLVAPVPSPNVKLSEFDINHIESDQAMVKFTEAVGTGNHPATFIAQKNINGRLQTSYLTATVEQIKLIRQSSSGLLDKLKFATERLEYVETQISSTKSNSFFRSVRAIGAMIGGESASQLEKQMADHTHTVSSYQLEVYDLFKLHSGVLGEIEAGQFQDYNNKTVRERTVAIQLAMDRMYIVANTGDVERRNLKLDFTNKRIWPIADLLLVNLEKTFKRLGLSEAVPTVDKVSLKNCQGNAIAGTIL